MKVLVINAGSSSLKYQLIDMEGEQLLAKGLCERIGIDGHLKHTPLVGGKPVFNEDLPLPTHSEAIAAVIDKLTSAEYGVVSSMHEIDAVGHRVVHGGEKFASSVFITDEGDEGAGGLHPLRPLHNPANITGINACIDVMGKDVPQSGRLRHRFPPDHARQGLYVRPCRTTTTPKTASAATASTAPATAYVLPALRRAHGQAHRGAEAHQLPHGQRLEHLRHHERQERGHLHGLHPLVGLPMGTRVGDVDRAPCSSS